MIYRKLVRDRVPAKIEAKGEPCRYHVATDEEYWRKLKEKLHEEAAEFDAAESLDEFADLLEVVEAIRLYKGWSGEEAEAARRKKAEEKGAFTSRFILDES